MSEVSVVTIGYYHYAVSEDFLPKFLKAIALGKIQLVTKHHTGNSEYKAVLGKALSTEVDRLEVFSSEEAEMADLKAKLAALEKKLNG